MGQSLYEISVTKMGGSQITMGEYQGKVLLLVNVASKCGLTPQYTSLENLNKKYQSQGLLVMGFPANEFLSQEPGTNAEIQGFCSMNYGVEFNLFEKIVVKGKGQHPLYKFLTETKPEATLKPDGTLLERLNSKNLITGRPHDIKWNFEKFLVSKWGEVVERFSPELDPQDPIILKAIERELSRV